MAEFIDIIARIGVLGREKLAELQQSLKKLAIISNEWRRTTHKDATSVKQDYTMAQNVLKQVHTAAGPFISRLKLLYDAITDTGRKFRMEFLSAMFIGMRVQRTFEGMIMPVLQATGVFEYFRGVLMSILLPVLMPFIKALFQIGAWLMRQPKWFRNLIGILIILGFVFGAVLATMGTFLVIAPAIIAGIASIAGVVTLIIGALALLYIAWQNNWFGIRDILGSVFDTMLGIAQWFMDMFIAVWKGDWYKVHELLVQAWNAIVDFLFSIGRRAWDAAVNFVKWFVDGIKSTGSAIANAILGLIPEPFRSWIARGAHAVAGAALMALGPVGWVGRGLLGLQAGGIVTGPTLAMLGERGPEAVIPLDKFVSNVTIGNINLSTTLSSENVDAVVRELVEKFGQELARLTGGRAVV